MKRLKREKGEGRQVVVYAPRLEFVSALCMFCTFCRFCRFLQIFAPRPTVRLAHVLVYLALVLVDLCTSITARQKKNLFTHFCNQAALLSFFVAFSMLWLKTTILQRLATRAEQTTHFFDIQSKWQEKGAFVSCLLLVPFSETFSFSGRLSGERKGRPLMNQSASVTDGNATLT